MPNGVKPAGTVASVNEVTQVEVGVVHIHFVVPAIRGKQKIIPEGWLLMASPVYTAPVLELLTAMMS